MASFSLGDKSIGDVSTEMQIQTMAYPTYNVEVTITALWLLAIELGQLKRNIVEDWSRIQKLEQEIAEREGHPRIGIAHQRCDALTYKFFYACVKLQQTERRLHNYWIVTKEEDRDYPAEVLRIDTDTRSLLGGFHTYHPQVIVPEGFLWPQTALDWCPPQQQEAIVKKVGTEKALRIMQLNIMKFTD
jgi:hypothetical protein